MDQGLGPHDMKFRFQGILHGIENEVDRAGVSGKFDEVNIRETEA